MNKINFFSLNEQIAGLKDELMVQLAEVMDSTAFSGGIYTERFESDFAKYIGSSEFVGVSSGSDALLLALRAMDLQPGDEVIVPASTFVATAFAVERLGGKPVFVDCDPISWEIDLDSVQAAIRPKTKGIICVHLYGQMCPMDGLLTIAKDHNLFLLEDCAQSQGAKYKGKVAGNFGNAGCFSFYPAKNLGACGEAGGVSTNDQNVAERIKLLRAQGCLERNKHEEIGYNMRMDGIQAAILSVKLKHLSAWNQRRTEIVTAYHNRIHSDKIIWQGELPETEPAWYLAAACVDQRDKFLRYMEEKDIICGIHYPTACHLQKAFAHLDYKKGDLPNAEWLAEHVVSLPLYPELSDEKLEYVIDACMNY